MIITCENCFKKFNINESLIPKEGRELQCGSCNYKWFFKTQIDTITLENELSINSNKTETSENNNNIIENLNTDTIKNKKIKTSSSKNVVTERIAHKSPKIIKKSLVFIISIIAIIILIDTFKFQLSNYIPELNFLLNNLYETLKDILLFFNDLVN